MKKWSKPHITESKINKITLSGANGQDENPTWHMTKGPLIPPAGS